MASGTAAQVSAADPGAQEQRREHRGGHDVHPGDEAGDAGRGVRQPGGLQDLRDAVEAAEHDRLPARLAAEPAEGARRQQDRVTLAIANRTARKSSVGTRSSRSWIRKNVEPQQAVTARSAAVASRVVRREACGLLGTTHSLPGSGQTRRTMTVLPLGDRRARTRGGARDVAEPEVDRRRARSSTSKPRPSRLGRRVDAHGAAGRPAPRPARALARPRA